MLEMAVIWCYGHPWVVSAACDLVTLACCMGAVVLFTRRRDIHPVATSTMTPRTAEVSAPRTEPLKGSVSSVLNTRADSPAHNRVSGILPETARSRVSDATLPVGKRRAVNHALAAMSRWEKTYRPAGQGLADLSRLAERQADRVRPVEVEEG